MMSTKPLPSSSGNETPKLEVKLQAFSSNSPPKSCLGHYCTNSRWCLGCEHDRTCRDELRRVMSVRVEVRFCSNNIKSIEG